MLKYLRGSFMSEWILRNKKSFIQNYNDLDISPKFILGLLKWLFCPLYTWEVL